MLKNTFCHVPGIGIKTEWDLWDAGVRSWDDAHGFEGGGLPRHTLYSLKRHLEESNSHLEKDNPHYFADLLPADQHWRLFPQFLHSVAYLDIETNGFFWTSGYITTIVLYGGKKLSYYIKGENLQDFADDIKEYKLIVTYNGKCFDLPFIENYLGVRPHAVHIDLRFVLRSLGYTGGLKGCEKQLGIDRGELDGVDGYFAVLLWDDFLVNGNEKALETLLAYNMQDVVSLEYLMTVAYNLKLKNTPFCFANQLPVPSSPELPFKPDVATIERIKRERYW
jgi:uncharacterized protein YprB with RNaseH-like and TPR domain